MFILSKIPGAGIGTGGGGDSTCRAWGEEQRYEGIGSRAEQVDCSKHSAAPLTGGGGDISGLGGGGEGSGLGGGGDTSGLGGGGMITGGGERIGAGGGDAAGGGEGATAGGGEGSAAGGGEGEF